MLRKVGVKSWFFFFICSQECQWFNCLLYHIRHSLQILEQCVLGGSPAIPTSLAPVVDALQEEVVPADWLHPDCQPSPHSLASWLKGNGDISLPNAEISLLWRGEICRSLNWIALRAKETFNWKRRSQKSGEHITVWRISNKMQMWWLAASENATRIYKISESSIQTEFSFAVCIYFCLNRRAVYIFLLCFYPSVIS